MSSQTCYINRFDSPQILQIVVRAHHSSSTIYYTRECYYIDICVYSVIAIAHAVLRFILWLRSFDPFVRHCKRSRDISGVINGSFHTISESNNSDAGLMVL